MPTFGEILQRARQFLNAGQWEPAEELYRALVDAVPQAGEAWHELGVVHLQAKRPAAAVECFQKALALDSSQPVVLSNLGVAYRALKRHEDAVQAFERALALGSPTAELYNNLALARKDLGQAEAAVEALHRAIQVRPNYAVAHFNLGNLLRETGRFEEALICYQRSLQLDPRDAGAYCQLGITYHELGQLEPALAAFDRALEVQPVYPEMRRSRALVWLTQGRYAEGWREFEWRWQCDDFRGRPVIQPRWDGGHLAGRTLLVHAEQGLGDTLHFVRYVPFLAGRGGKVWLDVQPALVPLLQTSGFGEWLVQPGETVDCDLQCPLLSLPGVLPELRGEPFWPGPYLQADEGRVSQWGERLDQIQGFKVGIAWAGNPQHPHDRYRSAQLRYLAPLAALAGVRLVSLQRGPACAEITALAEQFPVVEFGDTLDASGGAFQDTAALMRRLDLVITVDTAIAHLAGGLGVPVWTALDISPDWRWLSTGESTAWYPSMRLFRQRKLGQWEDVFTQMATALSARLADA